MGCIHYNGAARFCHLGQRLHINHEAVIAETDPALGEQDPIIARAFDFGDHIGNIPRGKKLSLFDVDHGTRPSRR